MSDIDVTDDEVIVRLIGRLLGDHADDALITVEQAAEIVGLGRTAAYDAVRRGEIPSVKIGRRRLVPVPALAAWLLRGVNDEQREQAERLRAVE